MLGMELDLRTQNENKVERELSMRGDGLQMMRITSLVCLVYIKERKERVIRMSQAAGARLKDAHLIHRSCLEQ